MAWDLQILEGDITKLDVDAIVNAANESLMGGGGVDGAIHYAAGPGLVAECVKIGGCPTGEARITGGYNLAARHVIHTVGPIWRGGARGEEGLLEACYRNSLALAREAEVRSIAFPAISTGVYRFPLDRAANIATATITAELNRAHGGMERITFCTYGKKATAAYEAALAEL